MATYNTPAMAPSDTGMISSMRLMSPAARVLSKREPGSAFCTKYIFATSPLTAAVGITFTKKMEERYISIGLKE